MRKLWICNSQSSIIQVRLHGPACARTESQATQVPLDRNFDCYLAKSTRNHFSLLYDN